MSGQQIAAQLVVWIASIVLGAYGLPIATSLVKLWVRAYTHATVFGLRADRRAEMASDMAEQIGALRAEGYRPSEIGARVLVRMMFGVWSDLVWMAAHLQVLESLRYSRFAVNVDFALFYLLRATAQREIDHKKRTRQQGLVDPQWRRLLRAVVLGAFVRVLLFGMDAATHNRDRLQERVDAIEARLRMGGLWPEDRLLLESEASRLQYVVRNYFKKPELRR